MSDPFALPPDPLTGPLDAAEGSAPQGPAQRPAQGPAGGEASPPPGWDPAGLLQLSPAISLQCLYQADWPVEFVTANLDRFGFQAGELVADGRPWLSLVHPQDRERLRQETAQALARGREPFNLHYRLVDPAGRACWLESRTSFQGDPATGPLHLLAVLLPQGPRGPEEAELWAGHWELAQRVRERTQALEQKNQELKREMAERLAVENRLRETRDLLHQVLDCATLGIFTLDLTGRFLSVNRGFQDVTGYPADEILGRPYGFLVQPGSLPWVQGLFERLVAGREKLQGFEVGIIAREGRSRLLLVNLVPLVRDGRLLQVVGTAEDITARRHLEEHQQMAVKVIDHSREGIIVADAEGVVRLVNPAFSLITGYPSEEVVGREMNLLRADSHETELVLDIWEALTTQGQWSGQYWNRKKSGEVYPEWLTLSRLESERGSHTGYMAIFHDITELVGHQEELARLAFHDALTGLPNRHLVDDRLDRALAHARRHGEKVGVLFLDLDNFKPINDSLGHEVGDAVLQEAARRLATCLREEDTVARWGGDEFIVLLSNPADLAALRQVADSLLRQMRRPFAAGDQEFLLGASLGLAQFPDHGQEASVLIRHADQAMYLAKARGGNQLQVYPASVPRPVTRWNSPAPSRG
ncbi:MAG: diguanylate cyclase [Deltaproteobacteria bacterium]|nr:diguanylate cyclase [Deltaproteobacteria bacterium]